MKKLFSFGHGYSAQALEPLLLNNGWEICGTTRDPDKAKSMEDKGIKAIVADNDAVASELTSSSHLLVSAGPDEKGDPMLAQFFEELTQAAANLKWIGYLSTTGVYGDHQGGWVDEETPTEPSTKRGEQRVFAENQWISFCDKNSIPLSIFRLAGIYGPGRGPFSKIKNGTARRIIKKGQVFSRIHVDDIAQAVFASIIRPESSGIFNFCDDEAAPPEDVIGYAAHLLKLPIPPAENYDTAEMTPMARSFYAENKRVRNDKMKRELEVSLEYPNYRVGLEALLKQSEA